MVILEQHHGSDIPVLSPVANLTLPKIVVISSAMLKEPSPPKFEVEYPFKGSRNLHPPAHAVNHVLFSSK